MKRRRVLQIVLPILVVLVGIVAAVAIVRLRPEAETRVPDSVPPLVRVRTLQPGTVRLSVHSQGNVVPRTETTLAPQVPGKVVRLSPSFVSGGYVRKGELLVQLDALDFELDVTQAEATVARARVRLAREEAEARVAEAEWKDLGEGEPTPLAQRTLQVQEARAEAEAAQATLRQARANLERTRLEAPFDGRVRSKNVDVGQFVGVGQPLGVLYAIDVAEVRLPLPDEDLAFIQMPLVFREQAGSTLPARKLPEVTLRTSFAGGRHEWTGRIVRTEGEIDARSRMVHVIVQVDDPYGMQDASGQPPLAVGMFVDAEIHGDTLRDVFVVPRAAIRDRDQVLIVDDEDRIRFRTIQVVRHQGNEAIVRSGLAAGDRLCVSPLAVVTDGMRVRTVEAPAPARDTVLGEGDAPGASR